jgi:hypothetical protein
MCVYGTTGSAKTTLTSGFCGKKLKSVYNEFGELVITIDDQNTEEQGITKIPVRMSRDCGDGLVRNIYDTTGFNDAGGHSQEIANSFYNKRIMEITKKMKFVLVIHQCQIT